VVLACEISIAVQIRRNYRVATKNEINVTDPPFNAVANDGSDQTAHIKMAIDAAQRASSSGTAGAAAQRGGTVYIPSGEFHVSGSIYDTTYSLDSTYYGDHAVTIRGDLPGLPGSDSAGGTGTRLVLLNDVSTSTPIFKVFGNGSGVANHTTGFQLRQIILDGNGKTGTWLSFLQASFTRLDHVRIVNTKGRGIYGQEWWGSTCHDVWFDNVGDNSVTLPTMELVPTGGTGTECRNLRFEAVRFANHPYLACWLKSGTTHIYFLGCSWFGSTATNADGSPLYPYSNMRLDGVYQCGVCGCDFTRSGSHHISATTGTAGLVAITSTFQDAWDYGISLNSSSFNIMTANSFAKSDGTAANGLNPAGGGNIAFAGSTGNVNLKNQGGAGAVL
jgi:hypothetical protein